MRSITEPTGDFEQSEPSADGDQKDLDQFIAETEDAASEEFEAEEAKDNEEFGRIRFLPKSLMEDLENLVFLEMIIRFKDITN